MGVPRAYIQHSLVLREGLTTGSLKQKYSIRLEAPSKVQKVCVLVEAIPKIVQNR